MQIKINKEIREYKEAIFFGLSLRQFVFSLIALVIAVVVYFLFRDKVGTETISWICVLSAAPFAFMGFFTYQGMTAEQFLWYGFKYQLIEPKRLTCDHTTAYMGYIKENQNSKRKRVKMFVQNRKNKKQRRKG